MSFLSDTVGAFDTGSLFMTSTVFAATCEHLSFASFVRIALSRHQAGDWGDCCEQDQDSNDIALQGGGRLFSVYHLPQGMVLPDSKIWIITEASRECTTVLFPSEY